PGGSSRPWETASSGMLSRPFASGFHQGIDSRFQYLLVAGPAEEHLADQPVMVDQVQRGPRVHPPLFVDAFLAVPPGAPGNRLVGQELLEGLLLCVAVDA